MKANWPECPSQKGGMWWLSCEASANWTDSNLFWRIDKGGNGYNFGSYGDGTYFQCDPNLYISGWGKMDCTFPLWNGLVDGNT